jgi:YfiH family protein
MDRRPEAPGGLRWDSVPDGPRFLVGEAGPALVAFTSRDHGASAGPYASLNLAFNVGDDPAAVLANRAAVALAVGAEPFAWTAVDQVHGTEVLVVEREHVGVGGGRQSPVRADALVTAVPKALLAITVADCMPIMVVGEGAGGSADAERAGAVPVVAAVHAGWRGVAEGILGRVLARMEDPGAAEIWIGPHARACCYRVDKERQRLFGQFFGPEVVRPDGGLDLEACVRKQAGAAGIGEARVHSVPICTICEREMFFSYRGDGPTTGRFAGLVMLK